MLHRPSLNRREQGWIRTYLDGSRCLPPDSVERVGILDRVLRDGHVQQGDVDLGVSKPSWMLAGRAFAVLLTTWHTNTIPSMKAHEPSTMVELNPILAVSACASAVVYVEPWSMSRV